MPILQDGVQSVYGSTLIQMMHICNRYQTTPEKDRMHMRENLARLNSLFASFDQKVRPVTKRIRTMLLARKLKLRPAPTEQQIEKEVQEFTQRILPMLDH